MPSAGLFRAIWRRSLDILVISMIWIGVDRWRLGIIRLSSLTEGFSSAQRRRMMIDPDSGVMTPVKPSCIGPLAPHIDAFAARLGGEGYTSKTVHDKCELVAKLSAWLDRRDLSQDALDEGQLDHFHTDRRRQGHVRRGEVATGQQLLRYLRDLGCIRALPPRTDQIGRGSARSFSHRSSSPRPCAAWRSGNRPTIAQIPT